MNERAVDISVIIVSWNVLHHLKDCLASLQNQHHISYEVHVVDNASSDGTAGHIEQQYPWVRLIASKRNLGFAGANNLALHHAIGRHVLFLNPDTVLEGDTLAQTVRYLDSHSDVGVLGAKMLHKDGSIQRSVRRFPTLLSQLLVLLKLHVFFPSIPSLRAYYAMDFSYENDADVDQVMGAFFACPAAFLQAVGGWDERFFLWFEEVDLCRRARDAGWKVRYTPLVRCTHLGGESFAQLFSVEQQVLFVRSMLRYFWKRRSFLSFVVLAFFGIISVFLALVEQPLKPFLKRYVRPNV